MSIYTECTNYRDVVYCSIGSGKLIVGDNSTVDNNGAFNNKMFTKLTIPERVNGQRIVEIGKYAFRLQEQLVSVTINAKITQIGFHTFFRCESLSSINIPSSVEFIGSAGISCVDASYLTVDGTLNIFIDYPSKLQTIGRNSFERKKNVILYFGGTSSPSSIDTKMFHGVSNVTIFTPEQITFGTYETTSIGFDFFTRYNRVFATKCQYQHLSRKYITCLIATIFIS